MGATDVTMLAGCYPGEDCTDVGPPGLDLWFVVLVLLGAAVLVIGVVIGVAWVRGRAVRRRDAHESAPFAPTS